MLKHLKNLFCQTCHGKGLMRTAFCDMDADKQLLRLTSRRR